MKCIRPEATIVTQIFVTRACVCMCVYARVRHMRVIYFNLCNYVSLCICIRLVHCRFCVIISDNTLSLYYMYVSECAHVTTLCKCFKNILLSTAVSVPVECAAQMLVKSFTTNYINLIKIYVITVTRIYNLNIKRKSQVTVRSHRY